MDDKEKELSPDEVKIKQEADEIARKIVGALKIIINAESKSTNGAIATQHLDPAAQDQRNNSIENGHSSTQAELPEAQVGTTLNTVHLKHHRKPCILM